MRFEWDDEKARTNYEKHGVNFDEARTVFFEDSALGRAFADHRSG